MSPYIFVLVMEYLNRCIKGLKKDPNYIYHPRCKKLDITHLCFANDLLLFAKGDVLSMTRLKEKFEMFSTASGLKANLSKSQVFFGGVKQNIQQQIL
ncbi:hypothetical protein P3S68_017070 [Capsicum galapagoense]